MAPRRVQGSGTSSQIRRARRKHCVGWTARGVALIAVSGALVVTQASALAADGRTLSPGTGWSDDVGSRAAHGTLAAPQFVDASATGSSRAANFRRQATRLARGTDRGGQAKRRGALLRVFAALHIGVYRASGTRVVRGSERRGGDFHLYLTEVDVLAGLLRTRRPLTAGAFAGHLHAHGFRAHGKKLTAGRLAKTLRTAARRAVKRPSNSRARIPLMVRALGLRQGYDVARLRKASTIRLDALQQFLILADVSLRRSRRSIRASVSARHQAEPGPIRPPTRQCFPGANRIKRSLTGLLGNSWLSNGVGQTAQAVVQLAGGDRVHLDILMQNFGAHLGADGKWELREEPWLRMETVPGVRSTGYGPPAPEHTGHDSPGETLRLSVRVTSTARVARGTDSEGVIACGDLVGLKYPADGPLKGVPVDWDALVLGSGYQDLIEHGEIIRRDTVTNADGIAELSLRPKNEKLPGVGRIRRVKGDVRVVADALSALGSQWNGPLGEALGRWISVPRWNLSTTVPWQISMHVPNGLKFHAHVDGLTRPEGTSVTYDYSATACNAEDVYDTEFTGYWRHVDGVGAGPDRQYVYKGPLKVTFSRANGTGAWRRAPWFVGPLGSEPPNPTGEETVYYDLSEGTFPLDWSTSEAPASLWYFSPFPDTLALAALTDGQGTQMVKVREDEYYGTPNPNHDPLPINSFFATHEKSVTVTEADADKCGQPPS